MTRKKQTKRPAYIKDVVDRLIGRLEKKGLGRGERVSAAWRKTAGLKAAGHTRPLHIRQKVLTIEADSSAWIYGLSAEKRRLLEHLQKELEEEDIKDIRFKIGGGA